MSAQEYTPIPSQPMYQQAYTAAPVLAQVPGQIHTGVPVAHNMWKAGVFECFNSIPNTLMSCFCPCISLAQIASRLGAFGGYCAVLVGLFLLYALHNTFSGLYNYNVGVLDEQDDWTADGIRREHIASFGLLSSTAALLPAIFLTILRTRVRKLYLIQGSEIEDFCCAYFCNCCTIAQLATQVESYTPGQCSFGPRDTLPAYEPVPVAAHLV
ncbi:Aste57867_9079 [Aphanomyces stellatus]|uniref:Aste57867_9079 protein n=1 Tax=Aphanomyces stellatus TaxID=120398 RepID=A0A485KM36_9STRA|nr:hypothetical protein As57867_009043 [Aphanomyces stellatus]VFT85963.1 Aste57867_9079 [Aphanomyces stellatus]